MRLLRSTELVVKKMRLQNLKCTTQILVLKTNLICMVVCILVHVEGFEDVEGPGV